MKALLCLMGCFLVTVAAVDELSETLYFVEIKSENDASKLNYPNLQKLSLIKPKINNLTTKLLYQLEAAKDVAFIWGTVNVASMTPQFKMFRITECWLTSLTIDPSLEYQTEMLFLDTNNLTALPANLNVLKNLHMFSIEHNQIEAINAEDFSGLTNLKKVSLAYNKIAQISSSPSSLIVLPAMTDLYLNSNQLRNVSFANWSAPKMRLVYLGDSQLVIVQPVVFEVFPELEIFTVNKNPLNCEWLALMKNRKEFKERKAYFVHMPTCKETGESMMDLIERINRE